jgi:hypothetical protein
MGMEIGTIPTSFNYFIEGRHGELCVLAVKIAFAFYFCYRFLTRNKTYGIKKEADDAQA